MLESSDWLQKQINHYGYQDGRLQHRLAQVVEQLSTSALEKGFPAIFANKQALKSFYRYMNHQQTTHQGLLECFEQNLALTAGQTYFVVQDTTSLNFTGQHQKEGMGYLAELSQRGLLVHTSLVVDTQGLPIGLLEQQILVRADQDYGKKHWRAKRPFAEKESSKWVAGLVKGQRVAQRAGCAFVHVMDREADVLAVMRRAWKEDQHFLIRARHDRRLPLEEAGLQKLSQHLARVEPVKRKLELPQDQGKWQEQEWELKWQQFEVEAHRLSVVQLCSLTEPDVEWLLLSDLPVGNEQEALALVEDYKRRWLIEEFHKALKSGCQVEKRQFSSLSATQNSIALLTLLAVWLLRVKLLARTQNQQDLRPEISPVAQQVLLVLAEQYQRPGQKQKLSAFTAKWVAVLLGNMGGFVGNPERHMPGWQTLWLGYVRYRDFLQAFSLGLKAPQACGVG